ncbi:MAG: sigma-70 family RNA polymerase sigma factor [Clostridia bacterium]|nr:sigma-70 family RNA polymerase sigma factor [Clostridia bacterium]
MQRNSEMSNRLISEFTENYMEKLFYFCLKKTGSHTEAEDLTQDISLQIITALNKGTIPTSFSAWVWQIARNRYSLWAKEKHNRNESVSASDIGDYEIENESENILDEMILAEQTALLRRELAFIKSDYRNIVVAYYIENKSVRDIALSLSLPINTVKSRLLRARQILKEGMDMAREFGKRSYNPENITFAASGPQPSGLPWAAVQRKIPKNILLQASNNPSTLEELSIELGIALPYLEEEVKILHDATLLEKQDDKYITNFFILDKDCRIDVYNAIRKTAKERSALIREFIEDRLSDIRALGIAGDHINDNAIRWWLIPDLIDYLIENSVKAQDIYDPPKRANGETWGFVGYEITELPESIVMGHNGFGNKPNMFWVYKFHDYSMWDQCGEPEYEEAMLMCDFIRNNRHISSLADIEKNMWNRINGRYAHLSDDGHIIPDILVIRNEALKKIHQLFREHKNYELLIKNVANLYEKVEEIFKKYSHQVLQDNIGYNIRMELYATRMMAIHDLVEDSFLKLPEDPSKSSLGMSIHLR